MAELTEPQKAWLDALRSGEYKQGRDALRNGDNFCCLGVACEVALKQGVELDVKALSSGLYSYDGSEGVVPLKVQDWLGLHTPSGMSHWSSPLMGCTTLNDTSRMPFERIADHLEENADAYFVRPGEDS